MKTRIKIISVNGVETYIPQMRQYRFWSEWEATKSGIVPPSLLYSPVKPLSFPSIDEARAFIDSETLEPHTKTTVTYQYNK